MSTLEAMLEQLERETIESGAGYTCYIIDEHLLGPHIELYAKMFDDSEQGAHGLTI